MPGSHRQRLRGDDVLQVLDRSTCVELLQTVVIGRVAWVTASGDAIVVPVNFIVVMQRRQGIDSASRLTTQSRLCRSGGVSC